MNYYSIKLIRTGKQISTSSKKSKLDGRGRFRYTNHNSPEYKPQYGSTYTQRQLDIIEERIPLSKVRLNELTLLMRKACVFGDKEIEEVVSIMRKKKTDPNYYEPNMTDEEATRILTELLSSKR